MIEIPKDFPWRAGMLATSAATGRTVRLQRNVDGDGWWRAVDADTDEITEGTTDALAPVFADHPTVGGLLGAVREAWRSPHAYVRRNGTIRTDDNRIVPAWEVCDLYLDDEGAKAIGASRGGGVQCALLLSEADALLAAWNARPVKA